MFGILRAAVAKPLWSSAPSMIRGLVRPRPEKCPISALVLAVSSVADSITIRPPSLAFAESAWRSASARTFFGRANACERTTGPNARPPPRTRGTRAGAVTRPAGPFLLVHLLAGAPDIGATLRLVGPGLTLGELPVDAALDDILARLQAENLVRKLNRASCFAFKRCDFQFHLTRPPARPAPQQPARRHRRPGGTCRALARPWAILSPPHRAPT